MSKKRVYSNFISNSERLQIEDIIANFDEYDGVKGERNTIKTIALNDENISVKSFKIPNLFNQFIYSFVRPSKAKRSFKYAHKLINRGIGTPRPLAYFEYRRWGLFKESYYVCDAMNYDFLFRDLIRNFDLPDYDNMLRAFTRFTYNMHENDVEFLDHSPGNTLIKKETNSYSFYLVDLNRMRFRTLDFKSRIKNFSKLTPHKSMVKVMSDEYATCSGKDFNNIYNLMWKVTEAFQNKYNRKARLKERIKS